VVDERHVVRKAAVTYSNGRRVLAAAPVLCAFLLAAAVVAGASARSAEPPPNDDRANAQVISAFPTTIDGTTLGATVERLDPQRSQCGTVESTVWYRINQAPDGTISLNVQGAGLTPVVRVYNVTKNGITELDCAAAKASSAANVVWETTRGNSYLVLVGKKTGTADAGFRLTAQLFLPPANDSVRQATKIALGAQLNASTLGATRDDNDPDGCGLAGGTVWYSISPGGAFRVVVRLHAAGDMDAAAVVLRRLRSQTESVGCVQTDRKGDGVLAWNVDRGAVYLLAVGLRKGSSPGDFSLRALAAQPGEAAPGRRLGRGGVRSRVDWLTDVNDVWWMTLVAGTTYRIAFSSSGCAALTISGNGDVLRSFTCSGYATITPGPKAAGRYVFEVTAPERAGSSPYRLKVLPAGPDDVGVGLSLANLTPARGALAPAAGDVVDLYHFDVPALSAVRLRLETGHGFSISLLTYGGARLGSGQGEVDRTLAPGNYVAAVNASVGAAGGAYSLLLVIRQVTKTTLTASSPQVPPGAPITFTIGIAPPPDGGLVEVQIDRFDTLAGWHFHRIVRVRAGGAFSWTPPAPGRWRARASYLGTIRYSPSRSGYSTVLVAKPIAGG
jgi:hypothetical protein